MKKGYVALLAGMLLWTGLQAGCAAEFNAKNEITVISREANSGTRGAFDEMMGILVKTGDRVEDRLFEEAVLVDSTDAVASKVEVDAYAIGYTSLGAVTSYVKAVSVNGVEATVEHVKDETYPLSRPFVLAASAGENALRDDFLRFVCSADGQAIVADKGYIPAVKDAKPYVMTEVSGKLTLSGSTSVEKVMEKLKEAYVALHPNAVIELTYSGSSAGIKDATEGKVEIALSSRALKEEEKATLTETVFAHDGIAVIVHRDNPVTALTSEQITAIFTGAVRTWADRQE